MNAITINAKNRTIEICSQETTFSSQLKAIKV